MLALRSNGVAVATLLSLLWPVAVAAQPSGRSAALARLATTSVAVVGQRSAPASLADQVEIIRTTHGVPHIRAENLRAAAYALAYVQLEDHGPRVAIGLLRARGEMGLWFGRDSIASDFMAQRAYAIAVESYPLLEQATRDVYDGFAEGANRYVELHPEEFPAGFVPQFTGYDIAARDVNLNRAQQASRFLRRVTQPRDSSVTTGSDAEGDTPPLVEGMDPIEEGSNAWAFAPSRTKSGRAILLRNPHLSWSAGYYEAHVTVPGVMDFYGDFRIGGPFGVIGGFNRDLGWSTTNNDTDLDEIYALDVDSTRADHYRFEGASIPLEREVVTVSYRNGPGISTETREMWRTPLGPVIHRDSGRIYVLRGAAEGEYRAGEQFLHMMRATSLAEWKEAMRIRARLNSNFTYADRAGNIFYVWNAAIPALPHPSGGDTLAIPARSTADIWTRYVPFDSLPQLENPPGGYVQNENDSPYFTNMHQVLDRSRYPDNFPEPSLRMRSQLSLQLVDNKRRLSLEDVVELKHSYRMLLADRVKGDLVTAVRATAPDNATSAAIALIEKWDDTAAPDSRGGVLFESWWRHYTNGASADTMFAEPWTVNNPLSTPRGLANPTRAAQAFSAALTETVQRYGSFDVAWGEVHRVRMGPVDVPVGGCGGALGCFRVLNFGTDPDGRRSVIGGDGWVLAVEFGNIPRAYSVLAYGESPNPASPYHSDQAEMFARGEMKRVAWTEQDVDAQAVRRYRPGQQP